MAGGEGGTGPGGRHSSLTPGSRAEERLSDFPGPSSKQFLGVSRFFMVKARHSPCGRIDAEKRALAKLRISSEASLLSIRIDPTGLGPEAGNQSKSQSVP